MESYNWGVFSVRGGSTGGTVASSETPALCETAVSLELARDPTPEKAPTHNFEKVDRPVGRI